MVPTAPRRCMGEISAKYIGARPAFSLINHFIRSYTRLHMLRILSIYVGYVCATLAVLKIYSFPKCVSI